MPSHCELSERPWSKWPVHPPLARWPRSPRRLPGAPEDRSPSSVVSSAIRPPGSPRRSESPRRRLPSAPRDPRPAAPLRATPLAPPPSRPLGRRRRTPTGPPRPRPPTGPPPAPTPAREAPSPSQPSRNPPPIARDTTSRATEDRVARGADETSTASWAHLQSRSFLRAPCGPHRGDRASKDGASKDGIAGEVA